MFGYVNVNKPELKIREYDKYKAYYCGLCKTLQDRYGLTGTVTLSYDITFLVIFLSSVCDEKEKNSKRFCSIHPGKKKSVIINDITEYASDMNIVLAYYKLIDDWRDDNSKIAVLGIRLFHKRFLQVKSKYPEKCEKIFYLLRKLSYYEKKKDKDIDRVSGTFGELMTVLFDYKYIKDNYDINVTENLRKAAFYLGKYIYLIDAHEDMEEDRKSGSYNILNLIYDGLSEQGKKSFENRCESLLIGMMAECTDAFEKLPCRQNADILKNILYSGVWSKYNKEKKKNCSLNRK